MGRRCRIALVILLMAAFLGMGSYGGYQLYTSHRAYAQGDETYEEIARLVISEAQPTASAEPASPGETEQGPEAEAETENTAAELLREEDTQVSDPAPKVELGIPALTVDFDALEAISSDAIGWLYCPDTVINYPVMGAEDYTYYLRHLADGTYNFNGSLFLDYNCQRDFSDKLSVIYGHNMKTEKMFGTLVKYKSQAYFDQHPYLYLYTRQCRYRIALIYGAVISAQDWSEGGFAQDPEGLMEYAEKNSTFVSPETYSGQEQLVVLSTCSYEYEDARYFLVGLLQPEE
jgi:sortase B